MKEKSTKKNMSRPKRDKNDQNYIKLKYNTSTTIEKEICMLADGLEGLLERFKEYNGNNTKTLTLVENMIRTSFKLGYTVSRKQRFKTISEEEFEKEMSL